MNQTYKCKICGKDDLTFGQVRHHVIRLHEKIFVPKYYDVKISSEKEENVVLKNETKRNNHSIVIDGVIVPVDIWNDGPNAVISYIQDKKRSR